MKINVNEETRDGLKKLKGVGDRTADRIIRFRQEGGRFNTLEEFQQVAGLRSDYLEDVQGAIDFGGQNGGDGIDVGNLPIDPRVVGRPFQPGVLPQTYDFTIRLAGVETGGERNPFAGYRLVVGYKMTNLTIPTAGPRRYSQSYDIGAGGEVKVSLSRPYLRPRVLHHTFEILINAPDGETIYEDSFEIEAGDTVDVHVPRFAENAFIAVLEKEQTISYEGCTLRADARIARDSGGVERKRKEFDVADRDEIRVAFGSYGEILDVDARVLSDHGLVIARETRAWEDLDDADGQKRLSLALPAPRSIDYEATLSPDPEVLDNPYADHTLTVTYRLRDPDDDEPARTVEESYPIEATRTAEVHFEHYGVVEEMVARVIAPGGEEIGRRTLDPSQIEADGEIEIHVQPRELADLTGIETLPDRPQKTVGRVIDALGRRNYEEVQVIIYATHAQEPEEEDYVPLLVAETESNGYFVIDTPRGYYTDAFARVGAGQRGAVDPEPTDVPIRLERDTVIVVNEDQELESEEHLFFPSQMILVVGAGGEEAEELESECGHLGFQNSKRVVDEYSYYSVVRTTEPDIQGYTLEEDGEMTVQEIVDTVSISRDQDDEQEANIPAHFLNRNVRKSVLMKYINDKRGLTFTTLKKALKESDAQKLREKVKPRRPRDRARGRHALNLDNAIDWDEDPTIYQATSIAHGHLLHFKQEWINDGYSIGDLLYSLPLAPGQKKQIVTFDWERRESASRVGSRQYQESLYNSLSRDRDVNEISQGVLRERMRGGSTARSSSVGGGFGLGFIGKGVGGLLGVSGGSSKSSSHAWQNSSRSTSMQSMQQLRDRTVQSANAVRSQRSTVVTTATQGERFSAETETVANYNHCHSITIQYFEVLRHLKVRQRLAGVQECLFVPFILSPFDHQKILRWREAILPYVGSRRLERGFDAIERIENDYEGSDLPGEGERYADEDIEYLEGELKIRFRISPPHQMTDGDADDNTVKSALNNLFGWLPGMAQRIEEIVQAEIERRNELFYQHIAPELAAAFVEFLEIEAVTQSGQDGNESTTTLPLDTTLVSRFKNDVNLHVSLRQDGDVPPLKRAQVKSIAIRKASSIILNDGRRLSQVMPENSQILVRSGRLRYRTAHFSGELFDKSRIMDDLVGYGAFQDQNRDDDEPIVVLPEGYGEDSVRVATPLTTEEMRNPRHEDLELANELLGHLNDNLEHYHRLIWMNMSDERRFMLLDGIRVTDYSEPERYPRGIVRSAASVVENRVIGVVGNSLVMPVAPGFRLDPNIKGREVDLLSLYEPQSPIPPTHVAIPTSGVYAESVMGQCNSCEKKQEDRFWRWSEEPIPQDPTAIQPVSTESRRAEPQDTTPQEFPQPMVNVQNAPQAPAPQGMDALSSLLGQSSFENITGLEGNQANAIRALQSSMETARAFGSKAAELTALGKRLDAIKNARAHNLLSDEKAQKLTEEAIHSSGAAAPDSVEGALSSIGKIQEMVGKGELPADIGQKMTDAIGQNVSKAVGNGQRGLKDLISSGSDKIGEGKVQSVEAETRNPDGSSTRVSLQGKGEGSGSPAQALSEMEGKFGEVLRLYFDHDKAEIKEEAAGKIGQLVTALRDSPILSTRRSPYRLVAIGMASKEGAADYNQALSRRRAAAAKEAIEARLRDEALDLNRYPVRARGIGEGHRNPPNYDKDRVVIIFAETIPFIRAQGGIVEHMRGPDQSVTEFVHQRLKARDPVMLRAADEANLIVTIVKAGETVIPIPSFPTPEEIEQELAEETLRLYKEKIDQLQDEESGSGMWRELPPALRNLS